MQQVCEFGHYKITGVIINPILPMLAVIVMFWPMCMYVLVAKSGFHMGPGISPSLVHH